MEVVNEEAVNETPLEWPQLALVRRCQSSLVDQIVQEVTRLVRQNHLPLGCKMPSVTARHT